jgi:hypothetical protein
MTNFNRRYAKTYEAVLRLELSKSAAEVTNYY